MPGGTSCGGWATRPEADTERRWPDEAGALAAAQEALGELRPPPWRPGAGELAIAGCFVAERRGVAGPGAADDPLWAAAVVVERGRLVAQNVVAGRAGGPYGAGLLALRDGPVLEAAVRDLPRPDVLLVDATGRDHPRRAGLALHLGALLDIPTAGVTHRPLVARGEWPEARRGAWTPLILDGEAVGAWLRTSARARPLAVHAAWRTDVETAVEVVLAACGRHRTPEPLRHARRLARTARAS
jgi:deoxyribonuclease V